jgi:UDP-glucose 4-epimerase
MNIAITGCRGFIGSVLSCRAAELGHKVVAIDNHARGLNSLPSDLIKSRDVEIIKHDCTDGLDPYFFSDRRIDVMVHLAAGTGSLSRPVEELRSLNVEMTQKIHNNCVNAGVKLFVFPTTSLSRGVPDSPYVITKQEAMNWLLQEGNKDDLRVIPLEFCNVVGAYKSMTEYRKNEVHVIPTMVQCYLEKKPFVINGNDYHTTDGTPARDYVNILDVTEYILHLIDMHTTDTSLTHDSVLHVGTGVTTTALQLIDMFKKYIGDIEVQIGPRRPYDVDSIRCPSDDLRNWRQGKIIPIAKSLHDEVATLLSLLDA